MTQRCLCGNALLLSGQTSTVCGFTAEISQVDRIEAKLDSLIAALADEQDEKPQVDLDGNPVPGERDQSQAL